jgi:hypothetical protein
MRPPARDFSGLTDLSFGLSGGLAAPGHLIETSLN